MGGSARRADAGRRDLEERLLLPGRPNLRARVCGEERRRIVQRNLTEVVVDRVVGAGGEHLVPEVQTFAVFTDAERAQVERGEYTLDLLPELEVQPELATALARLGVRRVVNRVVAIVPDLICILDAITGEAIGTETIRYGQRVAILSLPASDLLTTERALLTVGPRAFGYDLEFVSAHQQGHA